MQADLLIVMHLIQFESKEILREKYINQKERNMDTLNLERNLSNGIKSNFETEKRIFRSFSTQLSLLAFLGWCPANYIYKNNHTFCKGKKFPIAYQTQNLNKID